MGGRARLRSTRPDRMSSFLLVVGAYSHWSGLEIANRTPRTPKKPLIFYCPRYPNGRYALALKLQPHPRAHPLRIRTVIPHPVGLHVTSYLTEKQRNKSKKTR
jgi:hypothetical protein